LWLQSYRLRGPPIDWRFFGSARLQRTFFRDSKSKPNYFSFYIFLLLKPVVLAEGLDASSLYVVYGALHAELKGALRFTK
jgi:hypothetical protein